MTHLILSPKSMLPLRSPHMNMNGYALLSQLQISKVFVLTDFKEKLSRFKIQRYQ